MILIDVKVYSGHAQVIRSDIGPELVNKCRDVQNEQFQKNANGVPLGSFSNTAIFS
jgi:hypothetical protein